MDLGALPGHDSAAALDANDAGQICGGSWSTDDRSAVLWQLGDLHDLKELAITVPDSSFDGAVAINNEGQMISGRHDEAGDFVTFLLTPVGSPEGDITIDCRVGIDDLLLVLSEWGAGDSIADLNDDGTVGLGDLLIVLLNWT